MSVPSLYNLIPKTSDKQKKKKVFNFFNFKADMFIAYQDAYASYRVDNTKIDDVF